MEPSGYLSWCVILTDVLAAGSTVDSRSAGPSMATRIRSWGKDASSSFNVA